MDAACCVGGLLVVVLTSLSFSVVAGAGLAVVDRPSSIAVNNAKRQPKINTKMS